MILNICVAISCGLALWPAFLIWQNLRLYRPPGIRHRQHTVPHVSVLIPARNEAPVIKAAVESVLANTDVILEVIVLDDHSTDTTAAIVRSLMADEQRVRLVAAPPLPDGWNGKQHACAVLATYARYPLLLFIDADVRLTPHGIASLVGFLKSSKAALVSGVPRQEMKSWLECLLLPLIHFLLLGFLPMKRMRTTLHPAYGAGCGQLFLTHKKAYEHAGGHHAIKTSLHDGLTLPRAFRAAGYKTDICDATHVAICRMYSNAREVWNGLAKNATEGLGSPRIIWLATFFLFGGQVLPFCLGWIGLFADFSFYVWLCIAIGILVPCAVRCHIALQFAQPFFSCFLHPVGILVLLAIQWYAWGRFALGYAPRWKGRTYPIHKTLY